MSLSRTRAMASGVAAAAVVSIGALAYTAFPTRSPAPGPQPVEAAGALVRAATGAEKKPGPAQPERERSVRIKAPNTQVNVDRDRGKVSVQAPYTDVNVDPDKGRVRVRAPYVNLDIRW